MDSVIYSEPFKIIDNKEHQFRVTISENNFFIDYVICNEESEDIELIINYEKNLYESSIIEAKELINNNIDFRNKKNIKESNELLLKEISSNEEDIVKQEEIKTLQVINELYDYLINNYFD